MKRKLKERLADNPVLTVFFGEMDFSYFGLLLFSFLTSIILLVLSFSLNRSGGIGIFSDFEIGKEAPRDLVLSRDFIFLDYEATEAKKLAREELLLPVFRFDENSFAAVKEKIQKFRLFIGGRKGPAAQGSSQQEQENYYASFFSAEELDFLSRRLTDEKTFTLLLKYTEEVFSRGYYNIPDDFQRLFPKGLADVRRTRDGKEFSELADLSQVVSKENLKEKLTDKAKKDSLPFEQLQAIYLLAFTFFKENVFFDNRTTQRLKNKILSSFDPVFKRLPQGSVLVSRGTIVSEYDMTRIKLLKLEEAANRSTGIAGMLAYLAMLYGLAIALLRPPMLERRMEKRQFVLLVALDLFYFVFAMFFQWFFPLADRFPFGVLLPSALVAIFISVLISYRASITNAAILCLGQVLITGTAPESVAFVFFSGVIGARVVRTAEQRIDLLRAGVYLAIAHAIAAVVIAFLGDHTWISTFKIVLCAVLNGIICGILNLAVLPFLEHVMNATTKFRLLELSDLNSPILKRMLSLAPGTYTHSMSVANLAENACREIGANALLARVGAYYHDIGKIDQAEYFIENQNDYNKHDELRPGLSSAIIKAHVKIGVELATKLGLPEEVRDIIAQHHGSGLIRIFYQRALENQEDTTAVEDFSYSGTPPKSKEATIVMLADSIEGSLADLEKTHGYEFGKMRFVHFPGKDRCRSGPGFGPNAARTRHRQESLRPRFGRLLPFANPISKS